MGRSRGGLTTKIHLLSDGMGLPLRLKLTAGQVGDVPQAVEILGSLKGRGLIADRAYDSNALREHLAQRNMKAVIPCNPTRKTMIPYNSQTYKQRNFIERCFNKFKHFRRIATRFDRRANHFMAFLHLASALLWMR